MIDAAQTGIALNKRGWGCTISPWFSGRESPDMVASRYRDALRTIHQLRLNCHLAIKVPNLYSDFALLESVIELAESFGIRVHFDSVDPDSYRLSLNLFKRSLLLYDNLGWTIPARWGLAHADIDEIAELHVAVRVVRGQFANPVASDADHRTCFLQIVDLLAGRAREVLVATHDAELARKSLEALLHAQTPAELEQMFGLPLLDRKVANTLRVPMRVYIPYGRAYRPYSFSDTLKRPAIVRWAMRDLVLTSSEKVSLLSKEPSIGRTLS